MYFRSLCGSLSHKLCPTIEDVGGSIQKAATFHRRIQDFRWEESPWSGGLARGDTTALRQGWRGAKFLGRIYHGHVMNTVVQRSGSDFPLLCISTPSRSAPVALRRRGFLGRLFFTPSSCPGSTRPPVPGSIVEHLSVIFSSITRFYTQKVSWSGKKKAFWFYTHSRHWFSWHRNIVFSIEFPWKYDAFLYFSLSWNFGGNTFPPFLLSVNTNLHTSLTSLLAIPEPNFLFQNGNWRMA